MDRFRDMPETKDDVVTHLYRIFAFVDRYVDNYSSERVQKGIVDQFFNIRVKILQIIPDQYLCILLFKTMRRREHAVTQLGVNLMDTAKRGEGRLNEVSLDIDLLGRSKGDRNSWFDQIWTAGVPDSSYLFTLLLPNAITP